MAQTNVAFRRQLVYSYGRFQSRMLTRFSGRRPVQPMPALTGLRHVVASRNIKVPKSAERPPSTDLHNTDLLPAGCQYVAPLTYVTVTYLPTTMPFIVAPMKDFVEIAVALLPCLRNQLGRR